MKETKITQKMALTYVLENCELPTDINEKLTAMLAQVEKKSASGKGQTATQKANAEMGAVVLAEMEKNRLYTVTELMKEISAFANYRDDKGNGISNQKASAIVSGLVKSNDLERVTEKGRSYFKKVGE